MHLRLLGARASTRREQAMVLDFAGRELIDPVIARVLPLSDAADAHRLLEKEDVVGKIVLQPWSGVGASSAPQSRRSRISPIAEYVEAKRPTKGQPTPCSTAFPAIDSSVENDAAGGSFNASLPAEGQVIVLGLISTKTPVLESEEELLGRIDETSTSISSR
jgi:Zinc-binding dehydrogenase